MTVDSGCESNEKAASGSGVRQYSTMVDSRRQSKWSKVVDHDQQ